MHNIQVIVISISDILNFQLIRPPYVASLPLILHFLYSEGCRGQLSKQLMSHFNLNQDNEEQIYGIGIKELWQVQPEKHKPGTIEHTVGWPLPVGQDV